MMMEDSVAIVTGGGSGMGAATALKLANKGVKVAILDINQAAVTEMTSRTNGVGAVCDVADEQSVADAIAYVYQEVGLPRICVNCAGIAHAARVVGKQGPMPLADFRHIINVNLVGTFNVMRLVGELMYQLEPIEDHQRGVFINTASIAAYDGQLGQAAYAASKGGIVAMTLPIAREFAKFGIRVMTIAPGPVATPMIENSSEKVREELLSNTLFPKRFTEPEEFAALALHIIKNDSLNGEVIRLDGGARLH